MKEPWCGVCWCKPKKKKQGFHQTVCIIHGWLRWTQKREKEKFNGVRLSKLSLVKTVFSLALAIFSVCLVEWMRGAALQAKLEEFFSFAFGNEWGIYGSLSLIWPRGTFSTSQEPSGLVRSSLFMSDYLLVSLCPHCLSVAVFEHIHTHTRKESLSKIGFQEERPANWLALTCWQRGAWWWCVYVVLDH